MVKAFVSGQIRGILVPEGAVGIVARERPPIIMNYEVTTQVIVGRKLFATKLTLLNILGVVAFLVATKRSSPMKALMERCVSSRTRYKQ